MHGHQRVHVVAIEGLEDNDFIRWIEQRQAGTVERSGRASSDHDLVFRIGFDFVVVAHLARDGTAQIGDAIEAGVRVEAALDGGFRPAAHRQWDFRIADSLCQVHASGLFAFDGHDADL